MTDRERDDIAQLEYLAKWRLKKENRQYYKSTVIIHLKWAWYSFKGYIKGGTPK